MAATTRPSMLALFAYGVASILLAGFWGFLGYIVITSEPDTVQSTRREKFTLLAIDPPKHFYVDLMDSSGKLHERLFVAKHCNSWRSIVIGQEFNLEIITYAKPERRGGGTYETIVTGNKQICPAS